jgi:hypothetical protein
MVYFSYMTFCTRTKANKKQTSMDYNPPEKVTDNEIFKKVSTVYAIQMLINVFIRAFRLSCSEPAECSPKPHITLTYIIYIYIYTYIYIYSTMFISCERLFVYGLTTKTFRTNSRSPRYTSRSFTFCWLSCIFFYWIWPKITPLTLLHTSCDRNSNHLYRFLGLPANFVRKEIRDSDTVMFLIAVFNSTKLS